MGNLVLIYTTFPNSEEAKIISEKLLVNKLALCINMFPEVNSLYLWKGKINSSNETVAIIKCRGDCVDGVIELVGSMHSYDQPIVSIIPIEKVNFSNWAMIDGV